ncbi:MAG: ExbD/TolR family protein [Myxococcaceae bacterium]
MAIGQVPGTRDDDDTSDAVFADINITPLTDVVLVLLIIFMVTSTVIVNREGGAQAGLRVNLPSGGAADVRPSQGDLSVAILSDGRLVLAGNVVTEDELDKALAEAKARNQQTLVIVQADEGVPHGRVVRVMERAKAAGLPQLAIGVREQPK